MKEWLISKFDVLLPLAVQWAERQENHILAAGVSLTAQEIDDAIAAGVRDHDRVRLLPVKSIPCPEDGPLHMACVAISFLTPATRGLTVGHGIFVRQDCWRNRALIAHELAHIAQYERLGGFTPFLRQYLIECLTVGYENSPLEREAVTVSAGIFSSNSEHGSA
jgi:hypothetical protein